MLFIFVKSVSFLKQNLKVFITFETLLILVHTLELQRDVVGNLERRNLEIRFWSLDLHQPPVGRWIDLCCPPDVHGPSHVGPVNCSFILQDLLECKCFPLRIIQCLFIPIRSSFWVPVVVPESCDYSSADEEIQTFVLHLTMEYIFCNSKTGIRTQFIVHV